MEYNFKYHGPSDKTVLDTSLRRTVDRKPLSSSEKSVHRERSIRWGAAREPAATSAAATASALAPPAAAAAAIAFLGEFGGASSCGGGSGGPSLRYTKTLPSLMTRILRGFGNLGILTGVLLLLSERTD